MLPAFFYATRSMKTGVFVIFCMVLCVFGAPTAPRPQPSHPPTRGCEAEAAVGASKTHKNLQKITNTPVFIDRVASFEANLIKKSKNAKKGNALFLLRKVLFPVLHVYGISRSFYYLIQN